MFRFRIRPIHGQQRPVTSLLLYLVLALQPVLEDNFVSISTLCTFILFMVKLHISCSVNSSVRFKFDQLLEIGLTIIVIGIFM